MRENDVTLFIGGARSGKSRLAQAAAEARPGSLVYLATAEARDAEMTDRIARHRADRGPRWRTVECPLDLPGTIARETGVILVDCLTLWLSNLMLAAGDIAAAGEELCAVLAAAAGPVILVTNEVGQGIVPDNALARRFRDEAGRLHQQVAAVAAEVVLVTAGLPLVLKPRLPPR